MEESYISIHKGGVSFVGPDATHLFRANMIRASIRLHQQCGMVPTRGVTITKLFAMAGQYTGQHFKRGDHERAIAALTAWIETMKAALPIEE